MLEEATVKASHTCEQDDRMQGDGGEGSGGGAGHSSLKVAAGVARLFEDKGQGMTLGLLLMSRAG
jgi:hypothetical protein